MVTHYTEGPRGVTGDGPRAETGNGPCPLDAINIRVALDDLVLDLAPDRTTRTHAGYQKHANALRDKLALRESYQVERPHASEAHGAAHPATYPGHHSAPPPVERQRLVHSIFQRLGWPGGKPASHA
jgi:hypothetical protein